MVETVHLTGINELRIHFILLQMGWVPHLLNMLLQKQLQVLDAIHSETCKLKWKRWLKFHSSARHKCFINKNTIFTPKLQWRSLIKFLTWEGTQAFKLMVIIGTARPIPLFFSVFWKHLGLTPKYEYETRDQYVSIHFQVFTSRSGKTFRGLHHLFEPTRLAKLSKTTGTCNWQVFFCCPGIALIIQTINITECLLSGSTLGFAFIVKEV